MTLNQTVFRNSTGALIQIFYCRNDMTIPCVDVNNNTNSDPLTGELYTIDVNIGPGRYTCDLVQQLPQLALGQNQNPIRLEVAQVQGANNQRDLWIRYNNGVMIGAFRMRHVN